MLNWKGEWEKPEIKGIEQGLFPERKGALSREERVANLKYFLPSPPALGSRNFILKTLSMFLAESNAASTGDGNFAAKENCFTSKYWPFMVKQKLLCSTGAARSQIPRVVQILQILRAHIANAIDSLDTMVACKVPSAKKRWEHRSSIPFVMLRSEKWAHLHICMPFLSKK